MDNSPSTIDTSERRSAALELYRRLLPSPILRWLAAIGLWLVVALGSATHWWFFPQGSYPYTWWELVAAKSGVWLLWGALVPLMFAVAARFRLEVGFRLRSAAVLTAFGIVLTLAYILGYTFVVLSVISEPTSYGIRQLWDFMITMHSTWYFLAFWVVVGFEHTVSYHRRLAERERQAEQLRTQLVEAELERLKGRLQPHFLFNTLNTISSLVLSDRKSLAYDTLADLAHLLRLSLDRSDEQFVTLAAEMEFARLYLNLMTRRFPDALDIKYEVDDSCLDAAVPSLILQPLVENAVKYGTSDGAGWVRIKASRSDDWLHLEVVNPIGRSEPMESENGGRGLLYLRERLECLYDGAEGLLKVEETNGEFAVQLILPWSRLERDSASEVKLGQYNPRSGR